MTFPKLSQFELWLISLEYISYSSLHQVDSENVYPNQLTTKAKNVWSNWWFNQSRTLIWSRLIYTSKYNKFGSTKSYSDHCPGRPSYSDLVPSCDHRPPEASLPIRWAFSSLPRICCHPHHITDTIVIAGKQHGVTWLRKEKSFLFFIW